MSDWTEKIPSKEITEKITKATVEFANRFGNHLGTDDTKIDTNGKTCTTREKLTTNQLRKFFGEVKRQQLQGYNETDFVLLKPKLAYAVGRSKGKNPKIKDFYMVMSDAIDKVNNPEQFINFIKIFEAIVAYHKATEEKKISDNY